MAHDFNKFPELTDAQMETDYFQSPHRQITEDFTATCVKVIDGDTIKLRWKERNFYFPLRFINIAAREKGEAKGDESQSWLEKRLLYKEVDIKISSSRVDKWGRLLGIVMQGGLDVGEESMAAGMSTSWENRTDGQIPDLEREARKWLNF